MSPSIEEHPGFPHVERLLTGGAPSPMTADLLASLGVTDPAHAARNLQSLALHPAFPREDPKFLAQLLTSLGETFEPERALSNFERILETREDPDALLKALRRSAERRSIVFTIAGGSQFLSDTVLRHPEYLDWLLRPSTLRDERSKQKMQAELWRWVRQARDEPGGPENAIRRFRHREYLRIGLLDLMRRVLMQETTRELSHLADACLEVAILIARSELETQYGKPRYPQADGRLRPCEFAVVGLGKLGGLELNFSSDIDLLFVYSSDEGGTTGVPRHHGGGRGGRISNHDFHARLTRRIISLMAENTDEGHVFRIDTRLRPEGSQGALVYSLRSCEVYYESWGETWERQALIKSRFSAGSEALSDAFVKMIQPFIYRRTLDLSAIDEIARIKDRINAKLAANAAARHNVKLGEGGIREIEFIAQAQQLIYGGREPILRTPNTLEALSVIGALGMLSISECDVLSEAYIFLRDVEHRVQVTHGLQTHELPADAHGLSLLARKMGFVHEGGRTDKKGFEEALKTHQGHVSRIFENFFRKSYQEGAAPPGPDIVKEEIVPSAETLEDSLSPEDLAPYNFVDPQGASAQLRLLRNGETFQHISARAKRMFDDLLPRLLYLTLELPDPDRAVTNLNRFVDKGGGREAIFTLLNEQEQIFDILLRLFGSSDYLSEILISQPGLLDSVLQPESLTRSRTKEYLLKELSDAAQAPVAMQERFNRLCATKRAEELAVGLRSIVGNADILETLTDLTTLAEAVLETGLHIALGEMNTLYGTPLDSDTGDEAEFAIIAMGKLGSGDMNFGSDLDLIFLYTTPGETSGEAQGKKSAHGQLPNHEFFIKLSICLRDGLASPQTGERAYEIDLRLRPEGQMGPLAAPLESFRKYFKDRAEVWERQALTRSRYVAGSHELGRSFMALVERFVFEEALPENFASDVDHMRGRLERELTREAEGEIDIKLGQGGITDIEFIVQYLLIIHGGANSDIRRPDTYGALDALRRAGYLSDEDAAHLSEAYRFLRLVENRLRIADAQPIHTFPDTPEGMEMLARRTGFEDDEDGSSRAKLLSAYERQTHRVRSIYRRIIDPEAQEKQQASS